MRYCRICFDEDCEDPLEAPCACSGTSKFAHRKCIQKWIYHKNGNTTCEICLQEYRPGYNVVAPEIDQVIEEEEEVIIREIPLPNWDRENLQNPREEDQEETTLDATLFVTEFPDSSDDGPASFCASVAVIFIVLLLVKHMFAVLLGEAGKLLNVFWQSIIIALKSCGYIIPMYIIIWTMIAIQSLIQKYHDRRRHERLQLIRYNRFHVDEQMLYYITVDNLNRA